jgi:hypothetical protein
VLPSNFYVDELESAKARDAVVVSGYDSRVLSAEDLMASLRKAGFDAALLNVKAP